MVSLSLHTKPLGNHSGFYFWLFLSFFEENNMWIGSFQSMIIKHPSDFHILSLLHCSAVRHRILILCYGLLSKNWSGWWIEWIGVNTPYILLWQLERLRCQNPLPKFTHFWCLGMGREWKMSLTKIRKWELETIIPIMTRDGNRNGEKNWTTNILITQLVQWLSIVNCIEF